jgi:hypothetical protein
MELTVYQDLYKKVLDAGYGDEIVWQESLKPCDNADEFVRQYIWVVINSGMKNQIARLIEERIYKALGEGRDISEVFHHKGKIDAIKGMILHGKVSYNEWAKAEDKIERLASLPYIGDITKWHLAKNLGVDCVKPDRHLVRIAEKYRTTPNELCASIAKQTGQRKATVDLVIWRAANLGFI